MSCGRVRHDRESRAGAALRDARARVRSALGVAAFLEQHRELLTPPRVGARGLDVAAGDGRNARFLASLGWRMLAVDRDADALAMAGVDTEVVDLEAGWRPPPAAFDLVIVFRYLQRELFPFLEKALRPGGLLVYETFTVAHKAYRPMREAFLLQPMELRDAFPTLETLVYREVDLPAERRAVASIIARLTG